MKPKIIFIHGMFLNSKSWDKWVSYFNNLGYACEAPAWPLHEGEPADLRRNIPDGLGRLKLREVLSHYEQIVRNQIEPPFVIGHSMGGLIAQKLASAEVIRAGVAICSIAPNRMLSVDWGFLRHSALVTNPVAGDKPYEMSPEGFHKNFANTMSEASSNAAYEEYALHESRQVLRDIMDEVGEIDMERPHSPLLFIGADDDEIIPASLVRRNAHSYRDDRSHSEYAEFSGRSHFICGEKGWEEVALTVSDWLAAQLTVERF